MHAFSGAALREEACCFVSTPGLHVSVKKMAADINSLSSLKIGFWGAGKIAQAMSSGFISSGEWSYFGRGKSYPLLCLLAKYSSLYTAVTGGPAMSAGCLTVL